MEGVVVNGVFDEVPKRRRIRRMRRSLMD